MNRLSFAFPLFISCLAGHSQNVSIKNDQSLPNASAMPGIKSTTKGLLIPRKNQDIRNESESISLIALCGSTA
ncbi:MAG: hypothetical protein ABI760_02160 [Ferruginibacter sp.]